MISLKKLVSNEFSRAFSALLVSPLPVKASFLILKINKERKQYLEMFETIRTGMLNKFGSKDVYGKLMLTEDETSYLMADRESFDKEYNDLLSVELEISTIPMTWLGDIKLSPADLYPLADTIINPDL